jgi:SNF2 family DNA or RNA helicase
LPSRCLCAQTGSKNSLSINVFHFNRRILPIGCLSSRMSSSDNKEKSEKNTEEKKETPFSFDPAFAKHLKKLLKADLVELCREYQVDDTGIKQELINRLITRHEEQLKDAFSMRVVEQLPQDELFSLNIRESSSIDMYEKTEDVWEFINYFYSNVLQRVKRIYRYSEFFKVFLTKEDMLKNPLAAPFATDTLDERKGAIFIKISLLKKSLMRRNTQLSYNFKEVVSMLAQYRTNDSMTLGQMCSTFNTIPHQPEPMPAFIEDKKEGDVDKKEESRYERKEDDTYRQEDDDEQSELRSSDSNSVIERQLFVRPYRYQYENISWMYNIEKRVAERKYFPMNIDNSDVYFCISKKENIFFDTIHRNVIYLNPSDIKYKSMCFTRGAILGDEMGIGKTLCMTGLIMRNQWEPSAIPKYAPNKYQTKATLIVCPSQLVEQWKNEMLNYTCDGMLIYTLTTRSEWEELTYKHIMLADAIIISTSFLRKISTSDNWRWNTLQRNSNPLEQNFPGLTNFRWWRVIVDEGHEYISDHTYYEKLNRIYSQFRWYVSGTPLPNKSLCHFIGRFLDIKCSRNRNTELVFKNMFKYIYSRKTKDTIRNECKLIPYREEVVYLDMTPVERGLYKEQERRSRMNEEYLRMVCTHLLLSDENYKSYSGKTKMKTLEEIKTITITRRQTELHKAQKSLEKSKGQRSAMEAEMKGITNTEEKKAFAERLGIVRRTCTLADKKIKELQRSIQYFTGIVNAIAHHTEDECAICLSKIEDCTVTKCGHLFCKECIETAVKTQRKCPHCRTALEFGDLMVYRKDEEIKVADVSDSSLKTLVNKYGTKVGQLIWRIKRIHVDEPNEKIIIFSQWDRMLHLVARSLEEEKISSAFCQGSVYQRRSVMRKFSNHGDPKCLMLSLKNSASGLNLTNSHNIFILDTIKGSPEEVQSVEQQAISRSCRIGQTKQVNVVRMIIKNTIEEKIYKEHLRHLEERSSGKNKNNYNFAPIVD